MESGCEGESRVGEGKQRLLSSCNRFFPPILSLWHKDWAAWLSFAICISISGILSQNVFASMVFQYRSDIEDRRGKQIRIKVEKGKLPFRDYVISGNERIFKINGTNVTVGHRQVGAKDHENEVPNRFDDGYDAEFVYHDIGYRITAERGVTQEELMKIIQSIIK